MLEIAEALIGQTVQVSVGQVAELRLKENPTTGYRWQVRRNGEPACRIREDFLEAPPQTLPAQPGQGGTHVWRIEGVKVGICDLALDYVRAWESDQKPAQSFDVRIRVAE